VKGHILSLVLALWAGMRPEEWRRGTEGVVERKERVCVEDPPPKKPIDRRSCDVPLESLTLSRWFVVQ